MERAQTEIRLLGLHPNSVWGKFLNFIVPQLIIYKMGSLKKKSIKKGLRALPVTFCAFLSSQEFLNKYMRLSSEKELLSPPLVQQLKGNLLIVKRWGKSRENQMGEWAPGKGIWWSLPLHSKHSHLSFTNVAVVGMRIILHMKWTPCLSDAWLHLLWISCLVASFFPPSSGFIQSLRRINRELNTIIFIWVNWVPPNNNTILRCKFLL